jgi:hypothetical protein
MDPHAPPLARVAAPRGGCFTLGRPGGETFGPPRSAAGADRCLPKGLTLLGAALHWIALLPRFVAGDTVRLDAPATITGPCNARLKPFRLSPTARPM